MPGTIDDFIDYFTGDGPFDDDEVEQYSECFVSNKDKKDPDFNYDTYHQSVKESLRKLPEFQQAASYAVSLLAPADRQKLLERLLEAVDDAEVANAAKKIGLGSTDPSQMSAYDAARLMNYARTEWPNVLTNIIEEKPPFLKVLVGPVVVGALRITAKRLSTAPQGLGSTRLIPQSLPIPKIAKTVRRHSKSSKT